MIGSVFRDQNMSKYLLTLIAIASFATSTNARTLTMECSDPDIKKLERTMGENAQIMFPSVKFYDGELYYYNGKARRTKDNRWRQTLAPFVPDFEYLPSEAKLKLRVTQGAERHGPAYYRKCVTK